VTTTWRLLLAALLVPAASAAQAAGYLDADAAPASFGEAVGVEPIQLTSAFEPDLAEPAPAPAVAVASNAPLTSYGTPCHSIADALACPACCCWDQVYCCEQCCRNAPCSGCGCSNGSCCSEGGCSDGSCCGDLADDCCGPKWTVRAGAVILERARPRRRLIVDNTAGLTERGWTDRFDFGFEAGPDVTLTRWFDNGKGLEVRYFGGLEWNDNQRWTTAVSWSIPTNPPQSGTGIATVNINYLSRLNSTEINYRDAPNEWISLLAGFRWIELHEELRADADFGANLGNIGWNTDNHLYGGQLGAEVNLFDRGGPFTALAWFKGGLYGNDADNNFSFNPTVGPHINFTNQRGQLAGVGDIAFTGSYQVTRHMSIRTGYQLLMIDGVALASEQIFVTNPITRRGIDVDGFAFYHGAITSVDFVW
jgi:hypothetical protein